MLRAYYFWISRKKTKWEKRKLKKAAKERKKKQRALKRWKKKNWVAKNLKRKRTVSGLKVRKELNASKISTRTKNMVQAKAKMKTLEIT